MNDTTAFSVLIISIVFGVAVGAGCHQMGVVEGFSTAIVAECCRDLEDYRALWEAEHPIGEK